MKQMMEPIEQTCMMLRLRLKDPQILNPQMLRLMANDPSCLSCLVEDEAKGILMYTLDRFIPLSYFLEQYSFEGEEGYLFLKNLLEHAICSNRNKPVLFDPDYIFVSSHGDAFRFVVLPIAVQYWMFQQDLCKQWISYIQDHFKTTTAYEIPGYLLYFLKSKEVSLPNLVMGLDEIRAYYYPKKWYRRKVQTFKTKEAIQVYQSLQEQAIENETQILSEWKRDRACLQKNEEKYELQDLTIIGRYKQCDLYVSSPDVSLEHAKITCTDGKYYIQDLKSKNGTFLNDKRVQRKMRLREGMHVILGSQDFVFHEEEL